MIKRPLVLIAILAFCALLLVGGNALLFSDDMAKVEPGALLPGKVSGSREAGPFDLRGFGKVSARGESVESGAGTISLVKFTTENEKTAGIVASKYLTDLLAYGLVKEVASPDFSPGATLTVRDGGTWLIGTKGSEVFVLSGSNADALRPAAKALQASSWTKPVVHAYPKYLDFFDNDSLGQWWMPGTKPQEIMDFFKNHPAIFNAHAENFSASYAPNVYDTSGAANIIAQADELDKPFRLMLWGGIARWWDFLGKQQTEEPPHGAQLRGLFEAGGYNDTQTAMPDANTIQLTTMAHDMARYRDNPSLLGWLEPHGEFNLQAVPNVLPDVNVRYVQFLKEKKGYSLEQVNKMYGWNAKSWDEVTLPEMAGFYGRSGHYLDLDEKAWSWQPAATAEEGRQKNWFDPNFDDSAWPSEPRWSKRLLSQFPPRGQRVYPLWYRFTVDLPPNFLKDSSHWLIHVMPFTEHEGRETALWVNGKEAKSDAIANDGNYIRDHVQYDVSEQLHAGKNQITIYSNGGHFRYRVWLSDVKAEHFPFTDPKLSQMWIDWRDYFINEKFKTLELYVKWMRTVDPVHPIKLMTPFMFQAAAMDLCEKYGVYPQLTGEGPGFYRPMHYKGYARLRHLPGSSEPGGAVKDARGAQGMFANIFWESQDTHDYVFDPQRDMWPFKEVVQWWKDHAQLLRTLGKIDFATPQVGELRDLEQEHRFGSGEVWRWDLARGPLPSAGVTPVLIDGPDMDHGLADQIPVIFDCATIVMTPERVKAIERYVEAGGTFVALHNTGRHEPLARDSWPLAKAFGLHIEDKVPPGVAASDAPVFDITFTDDETLMPSMRGKKAAGQGISIDYKGNQEMGAVAIKSDKSDVTPIAKWADGTMAICEVKRGKGRIIWLGSPFHLRFKDANGVWLNDDDRQALFVELLHSIGVTPSATSSDPRVWVERRESKNGLYDVYLASAMNIRGKDWKLEDAFTTDLHFANTAHDVVFDPTLDGTPEVAAVQADGGLTLKGQTFQPFQVREFAVVRKDVGLNGPIRWLDQQHGSWRVTADPKVGTVEQLDKDYAKVAAQSNEDGLDLSNAWKVRLSADPKAYSDADWTATKFDDASWKPGNMGTWLVNGWKGMQLAQYRKEVTLPKAWVAPNKRLFLGFRGFHALGIHDTGLIWVNGKALTGPFVNGALVDVTEAAQSGQLSIAFQVTAAPTQLDAGPGGVLYLRSVDKPVKTIDLGGKWEKRDDWQLSGGEITIPGKVDKVFGLRCTFNLPADLKGKRIRLVMDQGALPFISGLFINDEGFMYKEPFEYCLYGIRVDRWLKTGENKIEIYGAGFMNHPEYRLMKGEITGARLEVY